MARARSFALVLVAALGCASCTEVTITDAGTAGEVLILRWSLATRVSAIALTLAMLGAAGLSWWRYRSRGVPAMFVFGLFGGVGVAVAPMIVGDRLIADAEGIHDVHGFPWDRRLRGFRYVDVRRAEVFERRVRSGRSSRIDRYWVLTDHAGQSSELTVGDLWDRAEHLLVPRLEAHGVHFGPEALNIDDYR